MSHSTCDLCHHVSHLRRPRSEMQQPSPCWTDDCGCDGFTLHEGYCFRLPVGILGTAQLMCNRCGSMVIDEKRHTEWHKKLGPIGVFA